MSMTSDNIDEGELQDIADKNEAPFLTSFDVASIGQPSVHSQRNSLLTSTGRADLSRSTIQICPLPPLTSSTWPLPENVDLPLAIKATTSSLSFSDRSQMRAWNRYLSSDLSQLLIADAFWWTVVKFFGNDGDQPNSADVVDRIESRIMQSFVRFLMRIERSYKDLILDNYADALAQIVVYLIHGRFATWRPRLTDEFVLELSRLFAAWYMGPLFPPIDTQHWKVPVKQEQVQVEEVESPVADPAAPSERLKQLNHVQNEYVRQMVPIRTVRRRMRLGTSMLVSKYLSLRAHMPVNPKVLEIDVKITQGPELEGTRSGIARLHTWKLFNRATRDQNNAKMLALAALKVEMAEELKQARRESHRRGRHRDSSNTREAIGLKGDKDQTELVAQVLKELRENNAEKGVSEKQRAARFRNVTDAMRAEYRLGVAPVFTDWK